MIVDPSSLIFIAVIGIWAAYLLGHWVRRRDQLATARSIDRFSDAMRVLERRAPAPTVVANSPRAHVIAARRAPGSAAPGAAVTAPVRRGAVAAPVAGGARARTVRPSFDTVAAAGSSEVTSAAGPSDRGRRTAPVAKAVAATRGAVQRFRVRTSSAPAPAPASRPVGVSPAAARRRGRLLAGLVAAAGLAWVFAGVTPLPLLVPALVTGLLLVFVVGLRRALVRERASARRAARTALRSHHATATAPAQSRDVRLARRAAVRAGVPAPEAQPATGTDDHAHPVIDLTATGDVEARPAVATGHSFPSAPAGPGWQPVPVPPPTYTLKPKAPAPARPSAPVPARADAGDAATLDLDEVIERRIASGA